MVAERDDSDLAWQHMEYNSSCIVSEGLSPGCHPPAFRLPNFAKMRAASEFTHHCCCYLLQGRVWPRENDGLVTARRRDSTYRCLCRSPQHPRPSQQAEAISQILLGQRGYKYRTRCHELLVPPSRSIARVPNDVLRHRQASKATWPPNARVGFK